MSSITSETMVNCTAISPLELLQRRIKAVCNYCTSRRIYTQLLFWNRVRFSRQWRCAKVDLGIQMWNFLVTGQQPPPLSISPNMRSAEQPREQWLLSISMRRYMTNAIIRRRSLSSFWWSSLINSVDPQSISRVACWCRGQRGVWQWYVAHCQNYGLIVVWLCVFF